MVIKSLEEEMNIQQITNVEITNVHVGQPRSYKLKPSCHAYLSLEPAGKGKTIYKIVLTIVSNDGEHSFSGTFMQNSDFVPQDDADPSVQIQAYLDDLVTRRNARISVHSLETKNVNTCVSLMYKLPIGLRYHAVKGDPRGMDNTKNPKIRDLLPFFETE
ncbi:MAG: hypothetical protein P1P90_06615 [Patescibacteria group bacterium]|nr:hypothetical protein [Patescibacteria group bacterium]